jgi:O-antigen ligase
LIFTWAFYLFVFLLPWQTKLILRPAENNFNEISLSASHALLIIILVAFFAYKLAEKRNLERISGLWISLAVLELAVLASFFFASDQLLAFEHYILFVSGIGLFFLLREETRPGHEEEACLKKENIIYIFLGSLFLHAVFGIYQFLSQGSFACKYLGLAAHNASLLGSSVVETASGRWLRAYGGFDHPNIFGGVLAIALVLTAYLLAKKKNLSSRQEILESIFLFIFYFVSFFALFFTFSRSAWLALALGLVTVFITLLRSRDRWIIGRFLALIFFSAVMATIVFLPYQDLVLTRFKAESRLEQKSLTERKQYFGEAQEVIASHWLSGVGTGNYVTYLKRQDASRSSAWDYQPVHNAFILLWAESGLIAIIAFLSSLFFLIKKNRRLVLPTAVFITLLIIMLFDHWLLSLPFGTIFLFFILGLI